MEKPGKEATASQFTSQEDKNILRYQKALELDPNDAELLHNLGWAYYQKGEYDIAISYLDNAIMFDPDDSSIYDSRGVCHSAKGDFEKAVADFKKASALDPNEPNYEDNLAEAEEALKSAKSTPAGKSPTQPSGRTCSACGHALRPTAKFCPSCGMKQVVVCGKCGAEPKKADSKFCHKCGSKL